MGTGRVGQKQTSRGEQKQNKGDKKIRKIVGSEER